MRRRHGTFVACGSIVAICLATAGGCRSFHVADEYVVSGVLVARGTGKPLTRSDIVVSLHETSPVLCTPLRTGSDGSFSIGLRRFRKRYLFTSGPGAGAQVRPQKPPRLTKVYVYVRKKGTWISKPVRPSWWAQGRADPGRRWVDLGIVKITTPKPDPS